MESLERRNPGRKYLEEEPEFPEALRYLWDWFNDLSSTRGSGFGSAAIAYQEICSWAELTGTVLTPWEVSTIRRLDGEFMSSWAEKKEESA